MLAIEWRPLRWLTDVSQWGSIKKPVEPAHAAVQSANVPEEH